ncbi:hypothetical protein L596_004605 [Steinernema carpocapsae]|uniref:Histone deacetylase domain-containing protein n=1 Tax=Steinernema carpocapsae TaxID=34508 RepID=A0A4U8UWA7_STECR|nr:hypothetical protein L596_004605 [Steinernema carpocapsae]
MDFESRLEELDGVSVSRKHFRKFGARGDKTGAPSTLLCHNEDSSFKHYPPSRIADHPESHKRLTAIIDRLKATDLFSRCAIEDGAATVGNFDVECLAATIEAPYLDLLKNVENLSDEELEHEAGKMDSVYFQKESFKAALAVLNLIFEATDAVWDGLYSNAIVIARPPGHHALVGEGNGFCLLNNVAHGAEHALSLGAQRVLIVDFDVHHGQGIQRRFEDSGNVTYFSVHRYEGGRYWPHLHESNFTFVGTNEGAGHTVNVPLSKTGANDVDYMAIFWNVLYPLALTVDPDFVIISAGFDACAGDPLGEMNVTPDLYAHWIYHLKAFANGKVVTVLEGGYNHFNQSVAVQRCVEALLGNSVAPIKAISGPSDSISKDILNTLDVQKWYWPALNDGDVAIFSNELKTQEIRHQASVQHLHTDPEKTIHKEFEDQERLFSSRKRPKHPVESESLRLRFVNEREDTGNIVQANLPRFPIENFTPTLSKRDVKVGLAFSRATCGHRATLATHENPERVAKTFDHLQAAGLLEKCSLLEGSAASDKDLQLVHSKEHIEFVSKLHDDSGLLSEDLYANESTEAAARHSVGCVLKVSSVIYF